MAMAAMAITSCRKELKIAENAITSPEELIVAVRSHDVGDSVIVKYTRDGKNYQATLILTAGK